MSVLSNLMWLELFGSSSVLEVARELNPWVLNLFKQSLQSPQPWRMQSSHVC